MSSGNSAVIEWLFQLDEPKTETEPTLGKPPRSFVCGTCFGSGVTHEGECERCGGVGNLPSALPRQSA